MRATDHRLEVLMGVVGNVGYARKLCPLPPMRSHSLVHRVMRVISRVFSGAMMSRFVRPMLSWNRDAVRLTAYTFAVSARAAITTAFSGPCAAAGDREHHSLLVHWQQQRRHRWAGVAEFDGSKQAVSG